MLRGAIMCPSADLRARLADLIERAGRISLVKSTDRYIAGHELERFVRANAPHVVFLSIESLSSAMNAVTALEEGFPAVQVVAVDRGCDPSMLLNLMNHGVREFLSYPFDMASLQSAMRRLEELQEKKPAPVDETDRFFSFLPSKTGVGASTLAMNAAVALSRMPEAGVLLMDLDVNSGLIGFMLKLQCTYTVYEAAENAAKLDEQIWPQLVARSDKLDILPAGRLNLQARIEPAQLRQLLSFARRLYKVICADLSGNLEKYSLEVMHESHRIFVVCTPEIPSLHLA